MITVTIPGEPVAQGRPRAARWQSKDGRSGVSMRDPAKSRSWKGMAQVHMAEALRQLGLLAPAFGAGRAVTLRVEAHFTCPASEYRKREPRPRRPHLKRPDLDNIVKAVKDAGKGILWIDDSQIHRLGAVKWIAPQGEPGRVVLTVEEESAP